MNWKIFPRIAGVVVLGQLGIPLALGQAPQAEKPLLAEDVFKNVQVLKGIPVNEFMETMGFFSAALSYNCTDCHVGESLQSWPKFAEDVPAKRTARRMFEMVTAFNKANFGGRQVLTCYSCHRGAPVPKTIPSLAEQYAEPIDDPNEVEIFDRNATGADAILDQYIEAVGGAQKLRALTGYIARGTYEGYDTDNLKAPVEIFAKPGRRTLTAHLRLGDSSTAFDGRLGWMSGADKPVPVLALPPGPDLDGLKLDADLSLPVGLKQALRQWRTGFPEVTIDGREVVVVQGTTEADSRVKLYFDKESHLLTRQVRYARTIVGQVPIQVDYSDYRPVAGVRLPFHQVVTWTSGRSNIVLSDIQPNAAIEDARFGKPAPPKPAPAR